MPFPRRPAVLVVDDEPTIRFLLSAWLKRAGFAVLQAAGQAAPLISSV